MFWNRSGKLTVELNEAKMEASLYVDGKRLYTGSICEKLVPKKLVRGFWEVYETNEECNTSDCLYIAYKKRVEKNGYKEFLKEYGVSAKIAASIFNSAVYSTAIAPYEKYNSLFRKGKEGSISPHLFSSVVKCEELLEQAIKDGQKNLLPIILAHKDNPQSLKKVYGKGYWKKLCANSFSRNKLIARHRMDNHLGDYDSSALASRDPRLTPAKHLLRNVCGVPYSKQDTPAAKDLMTIFIDTKIMSETLNVPFNEKWSARKMDEKHSEYSALRQAQIEKMRAECDKVWAEKMQRLKSINLSTFYKQLEWKKDGVTAKILTTYDQVVQEGAKMKHCVAGYAERCVDKVYCVVSLTDGVLNTTLGLDVYKTGGMYKYNIQQHYGRYNSKVEDERFLSLAEVVVQGLNNMKLKN